LGVADAIRIREEDRRAEPAWRRARRWRRWHHLQRPIAHRQPQTDDIGAEANRDPRLGAGLPVAQHNARPIKEQCREIVDLEPRRLSHPSNSSSTRAGQYHRRVGSGQW
jgi:hypothetical protein